MLDEKLRRCNRRFVIARTGSKTIKRDSPLLDRKNLMFSLEVVPGGGIEPPTRGFSISLVIRTPRLRIAQPVT
jgi:hypothetical protein